MRLDASVHGVALRIVTQYLLLKKLGWALLLIFSRYVDFIENLGGNLRVCKRGMFLFRHGENFPWQYFYWVLVGPQTRYLSHKSVTTAPRWSRKKSRPGQPPKSVTDAWENVTWNCALCLWQQCDHCDKIPFYGWFIGWYLWHSRSPCRFVAANVFLKISRNAYSMWMTGSCSRYW